MNSLVPESASARHGTISAQIPEAAKVAGSKEAKAWRSAQDYEGVFLNTMFQQMFNGIGEDGPLGGKHSEAWRGMLVDEYARSVSKQGGLGLAPSIYKELIGAQANPMRRTPAQIYSSGAAL
jgi:flagellar protein FlgJ